MVVALVAGIVVAPLPVGDTTVGAADHEARVLSAIRDGHRDIGLQRGDLDDVVITNETRLSDGTRVLHLQQRHMTLPVIGAVMTAIDHGDRVEVASSRFVPALADRNLTVAPRTEAADAAVAAASSLGLAPSEPIAAIATARGASGRDELLSDGGISRSPIPAELGYVDDDGDIRLAWNLVIDDATSDEWWEIRIDAATGEEISRESLLDDATYTTFDFPTESPSHGVRVQTVDPADPVASPFGWLDLDGVAGDDTTVTRGNNVHAYTDVDADDVADVGSEADIDQNGAFDHPLDLGLDPASSTDAIVTTLFHANNRLHDWFYAYGFDEQSGNFQVNNYGKGGVGGDALLAEALDGSGLNNANMATPPEGFSPRMQMFRWTAAVPNRSSSLDLGVVAHEYAHGVTNRLTGGPNIVTCLGNAESPSEGWSDYFALVFTMDAGDAGTDPRGIGTYLLNEPTNGTGIRSHPYSTDLGTDPRTYDTIATGVSIPHGVGSVFAAMLWDMTWAFIDRDGFDADLAHGTGGNNTAIQLVMDALKLQPCMPGFVDARDAILLADQTTNAGANQCLIWESFAKRGLGFSADQGLSASALDGTSATDIPPACRDMVMHTSIHPPVVEPGGLALVEATVTNQSATDLTNVTITTPVPSGSSYVAASADCAGTEALGVVTQTIAVLAPAATATCTFQVTADISPSTALLSFDDVEAGFGTWTASHLAGTLDWVVTNDRAVSGIAAFDAVNPAAISDQVLTLATPIVVSDRTALRFWHDHLLEQGWDGGVVEYSLDGLAWLDAGAMFIENGYTAVLNTSNNPLTGRQAFTGSSSGWVRSTVDLSSLTGQTVHLRFRFGSDSIIGARSWTIDDIEIIDLVELTVAQDVVADEGPTDSSGGTVLVEQLGLLRVTTNPALPSQVVIDGVVRDTWGLDWVRMPRGSYEICFTDVNDFGTPGCQQVDVTPGHVTSHEGAFATWGLLRVDTSPAVPSTISIDGTPRDDWQVWTAMPPGDYTVCFGDVAGRQTPACEVATVTGGASTTVTGDFSVLDANQAGPTGHGLLRVTTSPAVRSQITIDGDIADNWGLDWVKMAPGTYEICFGDVGEYTTPACETAVVTADQVTEVVGQFERRAELRVDTNPASQATIYVDGVPRDDWQFWSWIPAGEHEVCFGEAGGVLPACQTVTLAPGSSTTVIGDY